MQSKILNATLIVLLAILSSQAMAADKFLNLDRERHQTIERYLRALQTGSAGVMAEIFTANGTVKSTSVGNAPAVKFFNDFLPKIHSAELRIGSIYQVGVGYNDNSERTQYGASFSYHWVLKDGSKGGGAYVDQFYFASMSNKLKQVIMYENLQ